MTRSAAFALARRSSAPVLAAGLLAASLTLGGCENPKPRPNGGGAPAAPAVPPVIGQDGKPVAMVAEGMPAPPAWAAAAIGKPLAEAYPKTSTCKGHTDIVGQGFGGAPRGVEIQGWGWDVAALLGATGCQDLGQAVSGSSDDWRAARRLLIRLTSWPITRTRMIAATTPCHGFGKMEPPATPMPA